MSENKTTLINTSAEDLGHLLGFSAATRFMAMHEGSPVDIPPGAPEGHILEKQIGQPAFRHLSAEFGGQKLLVPHNYEVDHFRMIRRGMTINEFVGITDMRARQIANYVIYAQELGLLKDRES